MSIVAGGVVGGVAALLVILVVIIGAAVVAVKHKAQIRGDDNTALKHDMVLDNALYNEGKIHSLSHKSP